MSPLSAKSNLESAAAQERLERSYQSVLQFLQSKLQSQSQTTHWTGRLSTSALSTATAVSALWQCLQTQATSSPTKAAKTRSADTSPSKIEEAIDVAVHWLAAQQNEDGGFGDTDRSHSNIATSYLVLAAWKMTGFDAKVPEAYRRIENYIEELGAWDGLRQRYGKDKTFVVPILSNCALAGLVPWKRVAALPFEAAWLPQDWYRLARMPVVSYAIPALVAIGQARHHFAPSWNPLVRALRNRAIEPTLGVLSKMQPASGGYLEATPLTSFVLMNLAAMGKANLPVAKNCLRFLLDSRLEDGSWPIDTNLATWVTNLTLNSLARRSGALQVTVRNQPDPSPSQTQNAPASSDAEQLCSGVDDSVASETVRWVLRCQHKGRHPFTGAQPGGWGWTDLSGAVPDSDDTPAALLALSKLELDSPEQARLKHEVAVAAASGLGWLLQLQNRDGGWPTFCRGWGKLPFDRSGTDLTAHALRAFHAWLPRFGELQQAASFDGAACRLKESQIRKATNRGLSYLARNQAEDGSWLPLWFGNQDRPDEDNPIYGTSKVL
ncbi:MAG: prenyltransferase/squalene oxidase repeat-containing protein, partial [Planctomycetota bacterium]